MEKPSKIEGPKHIWANIRRDWFHTDGKPYSEDDVKYIRVDLVEKLNGYVVHKPHCYSRQSENWSGPLLVSFECTCGLTELLGEIGE